MIEILAKLAGTPMYALECSYTVLGDGRGNGISGYGYGDGFGMGPHGYSDGGGSGSEEVVISQVDY